MIYAFIVLPGAPARPSVQPPNLTKPLGDGTEIRVGGKACAHNVGEEMAYPSLWKRAHFLQWLPPKMNVVFLTQGSQNSSKSSRVLRVDALREKLLKS